MHLSHWPADTSRPVLNQTAGDVLREAARLSPDHTAIVEVMPPGMTSLVGAHRTDRRWTYAELLAEAENCAHWLLESYAPGDHLCIWAPNVPEWVILQYGAALAGLVLVTANPALRVNELRYVLKQSQAVGLVHADSFRGTDMSAIAKEVTGDSLQRFCMADWARVVHARKRSGPLPVVNPEDPAQIQYTSGTTGEPKGALLHHRGLVTNGYYVATRAGLDQGVFISPMPLFHTAGSAMSVLGCVTTRSTYVLPLLFDPEMILTAMQEEKANLTLGVPTMIIALIEQQRKSRCDLSSMRTVLCGGAPVPVELLRRTKEVLGCDVTPTYGQTELSPIVLQCSPGDSLQHKANSSGRPLWQVEVRIVEPNGDNIAAIGVEGEIQVRGYQRMIAYFGMPDATAQTILPDGWVLTGDLGVMDSRGYVQITGRLRDMIIRGGENVYPREIEAVLFTHPGVADVVVFGIPDPHWGEIIGAAIRAADPGAPPSAAELQAHCRSKLAAFKSPASWFICDEFPLTGSGKVQKFRLREMEQAGLLAEL